MPIPLTPDYDAARLRTAPRASKHAGQTRRLLALAAIYDGATRMEAATIGSVTLQIVRDWVLKLNAHGPTGLINLASPGPTAILSDEHRRALAKAIEDGPIPAIHGVVRWRVINLVQWLSDEFQVAVSKQTLSRELRAMSYRRRSARPRHHAQAAGAIETFKKSLPAHRDAIGRAQGVKRSGIEVWFADEARVGQKNKSTRRWAKRDNRPSAPQDQRTASTHSFGAICPATGATAGLVLPWCNTEAMGLHLAEIAKPVTPGKHCALLINQAG